MKRGDETGVRPFRFVFVGLMGAIVQVGTLALLINWLGAGNRIATILAVEVAVIHNFIWHENWTWRSRVAQGESGGYRFKRFCKFNLTNGAFSIVLNVVLTELYVDAGVSHLLANGLAIASGSLATYFLADLFVFHRMSADAAR